MRCGVCGGRQVVLTEAHGRVEAAPCGACVGACGACGGAGETVEERGAYTYLTPCACGALRKKARALTAAHLPALYGDALFAPPAAPQGYPRSASQREARRTVGTWVRDWRPGARGLVLHGGYGTGKTLLMCQALAALALGGTSCFYLEFGLLLEDLKLSFEERRSPGYESTSQIRGRLAGAQVLAVDELGPTRTPWEAEELASLISQRYQQKKTTLFATNYDAREEGGASPLEQAIGARLFSRLCERTLFVPVEGKDVRRWL